ncbi:MAG: hypothetical protein JWN76_2891 [Chitinophagaceae bacterium]|nr:hypothetical protein [Chitinophagaceae bacterium]
MPDSFENKMNQKMAELRLQPEDVVWQNIENDLLRKKQRRRIIFWWLLPLAGAGIFSYLYFSVFNDKNNEKNNDKIVTSGIQVPGKFKQKQAEISTQKDTSVSVANTRKNNEVQIKNNADKFISKVITGENHNQPVLINAQKNRKDKSLDVVIRNDVNKNKNFTGIDTTKTYQGFTAPGSSVTVVEKLNPGSSYKTSSDNIENNTTSKINEQVTSDSAIVVSPLIIINKRKKFSIGFLIDVSGVSFQPSIFPDGGSNKDFAAPQTNTGYSTTQTTSSQKNSLRAGIGVMVRYKPGNHFYILSGVAFYFFKTQTTNHVYKDSFVVNSASSASSFSSFISRSSIGQQQISTNNYNIQMPLIAGWDINMRKYSFGASAGMENVFQFGKTTVTNTGQYSGNAAASLRKYVPSFFVSVNAATPFYKGLIKVEPYLQLAGKSYLSNNQFTDVVNFYGLRFQYFFK